MRRGWRSWLAGWCVCGVVAAAAPTLPAQALDAEAEDAFDAAVFLLERATTPRRDGTHHRLLRALRHLQDPALGPLYRHLAESSHPGLKIHGLLGLGETSPEGRLDVHHLLRLEEPALQAELVSSALDDDLITLDDCEQVLSWRDLDAGVRLVLATRLMGASRFEDAALLKSMLEEDAAPGRRGMAAALLTQLGDPAGVRALRELSASDQPHREAVEITLLRAALAHELDALGPWAFDVALSDEGSQARRLMALRVALRFGAEGAEALWRSRFARADDPVQRLRLALTLLHLSPHLEPAVFETLEAAEEPLLRQAGRTGRAIASSDASTLDRVYELMLFRRGLVNAWAIDFAETHARPDEGQVILLGMLQTAAETENEADRAELLATAAEATRALFELDPLVASRLLRPYLSGPEVDPGLAQAILLGLVRAGVPEAGQVVADLPLLPNPDAAALQVLLRAKHGLELDRRQARMLRTIVRYTRNCSSSLM